LRVLYFIFVVTFALQEQSLAGSKSYDIGSFEIKRGTPRRSKTTCFIPALSAQQNYMIDEIRRIHLLEVSLALSKVEKNRKAYEKILMNKKIPTAWRADEAAEKLLSSRRKLRKQQTVYFHAVYYQVLLPSQREYLTRCL
jgi:hypothetical protein